LQSHRVARKLEKTQQRECALSGRRKGIKDDVIAYGQGSVCGAKGHSPRVKIRAELRELTSKIDDRRWATIDALAQLIDICNRNFERGVSHTPREKVAALLDRQRPKNYASLRPGSRKAALDTTICCGSNEAFELSGEPVDASPRRTGDHEVLTALQHPKSLGNFDLSPEKSRIRGGGGAVTSSGDTPCVPAGKSRASSSAPRVSGRGLACAPDSISPIVRLLTYARSAS
jgi:hypothetical protein